MLGDGLRLAIAGATAGLAGAILMARGMGSLLFGIEPSDPLTLVMTAAVLIAVTAVASLVPGAPAVSIRWWPCERGEARPKGVYTALARPCASLPAPALGLQYFAPTGGASFSSADGGAVAYLRSNVLARRLAWIARDGRDLGSVAPDAPWLFAPRLSPDGSRLAVSRQVPATGSSDLWAYDLPASTPTQLTSDVFVDNWVNWFPDGRTVILSRSGPDHAPRLMTKSVFDVASPTPIADLPGFHYHPAVSPDGETVVYGLAGDLIVWSRQASGPEPLMQTRSLEGNPAFSPDGRWLAYDSTAPGRTEVYVQPFGRTGDRARLSDGGGRSPRWRADGREVFFQDLEGRLIAVPFDPTLGQRAGQPRAISGIAGPIDEFDVTPDGQRFVVTLPPTRAVPPSISVLLNWHRLLE